MKSWIAAKIKAPLVALIVLGMASFAATAYCSQPQGQPYCPTANCRQFPQPTYNTNTFKDLAYASASSSETLDIYRPASGSGPFPTIVYVHGGRWSAGDKSQALNNGVVTALLNQGYAVASINYRLSGEAPFPAAPQDVKAAIRWLRANASIYNLNGQKFGIWGPSAGGNLASLIGTSCGDPQLEGNLGNASQSSCVQAVVALFGPNDFLEMDQQFIDSGISCSTDPATHNLPSSPESLYVSNAGDSILDHPDIVRQANPITYVSGDEPPFFLQHGTADCVVPSQQSQMLYDALIAKIEPNKVSLAFLDGYAHADPRFTDPSNLDLVVVFLDKYLKNPIP